ncbi:MAG: winged helix-turn-helix transcriptional regulator [Clostridia bacterium]|nr:winged helix-turn-helix transcriptional regulator [Clostridia bacterium]
MRYHEGIIPFYEARYYLAQRFTKDRTSQKIEKNRYKKDAVPSYDFTYLKHITELEKELDERFEVTELMTRFFTPLKLKEQREGTPITIGDMLLTQPVMLFDGISVDTLIDKYRQNSQAENLTNFYTYLYPFGLTDGSVYSLSDLMQAANELFADPEEKWAIVDAAANPAEQLEKLKPLVEAISDLIGERKAVFDPIVKRVGEFVASEKDCGEFFVSRMHFEKEELEKMLVFPCIFKFDELNITGYEDNDDYEVTMGCFYEVMASYVRHSRDPETHIALLKVLSDSTRFKVLHELCDQSSYGLELAEKYGITRNAMYYQLDQLLGYCLVKTEYEGRRMLHTMDKRTVYEKLTELRDYLVNGWKPEDEE